jgi:hypothetical protein
MNDMDNLTFEPVPSKDIYTLAVALHRITGHLASPAFRLSEAELKDLAGKLLEIVERGKGTHE